MPVVRSDAAYRAILLVNPQGRAVVLSETSEHFENALPSALVKEPVADENPRAA